MNNFDNPTFLFIKNVFLKDIKKRGRPRKKKIIEKQIIKKCNHCNKKKSNDKYRIPLNIESKKQIIKSNENFCSVICIKKYIDLNYDYFKVHSLLQNVNHIYE